MFNTLLAKIAKVSSLDFVSASKVLNAYIDSARNFIDLLEQIGTIPESIIHDSTEEKLFSKASDAVLSRAFREIGLKSVVLKERADSADVLIESPIHGYTMVADAKAFRMSRTAKNQKDFKVAALSGWRKDADYAVLCAPYFQYPNSQSQIFAQALQNNVCLFSWEHLIFMVKQGIKESEKLNLSPIWSFSNEYSDRVIFSKQKQCFLPELNKVVLATIGVKNKEFQKLLNARIDMITDRGRYETAYWEREKITIEAYTKKQAIDELIKSKKIDEKIRQITQYVQYVGGLAYD